MALLGRPLDVPIRREVTHSDGTDAASRPRPFCNPLLSDKPNRAGELQGGRARSCTTGDQGYGALPLRNPCSTHEQLHQVASSNPPGPILAEQQHGRSKYLASPRKEVRS